MMMMRTLRFVSMRGAVGLFGLLATSVPARPARADVQFANTDCSEDERDTVRKAFTWGRDLADRADGFMTHLVNNAPPVDGANGGVDGDDRRRHYERWFGPLEVGRVSTVQKNVAAIRQAFTGETILVRCKIASQLSQECMANKETIAWVNASEIKKSINLCEPFWNKPRSGINSQGGRAAPRAQSLPRYRRDQRQSEGQRSPQL